MPRRSNRSGLNLVEGLDRSLRGTGAVATFAFGARHAIRAGSRLMPSAKLERSYSGPGGRRTGQPNRTAGRGRGSNSRTDRGVGGSDRPNPHPAYFQTFGLAQWRIRGTTAGRMLTNQTPWFSGTYAAWTRVRFPPPPPIFPVFAIAYKLSCEPSKTRNRSSESQRIRCVARESSDCGTSSRASRVRASRRSNRTADRPLDSSTAVLTTTCRSDRDSSPWSRLR